MQCLCFLCIIFLMNSLDEWCQLSNDLGNQVRVGGSIVLSHSSLDDGFGLLYDGLDRLGDDGLGDGDSWTGADLDKVGLLSPLLPVAVSIGSVPGMMEEYY